MKKNLNEVKRLQKIAGILKENGIPSQDFYRELDANSVKGDPLDFEESEQFVSDLRELVASRTLFSFSEANDDNTEYFFDNDEGIKVGVSLVKSGDTYLWKVVCSDPSLESAHSEGEASSVDEAGPEIFDAIADIDDIFRNG